MQFSTIIAIFAASVVAAPVAAPAPDPSFLSGVSNDIKKGADKIGLGKQPDGCDTAKCAAALGPAVVGCGVAAVQAGVDPAADAACVATGLNTVVNAPAGCANCKASNLIPGKKANSTT